jgi:transcriptional regulator
VVLVPERGKYGALQLHLARQNEHWRDLAAGAPAMVVFQGPHAYISPMWYRTAVAVPTWNYVAVHAYGTARLLDDAELKAHLQSLTASYERAPGGWSMERIPEEVLKKLLASIVGCEIVIERIEGKWKLGQNRTDDDVQGAISGLHKLDDPEAKKIAHLMKTALQRKGRG